LLFIHKYPKTSLPIVPHIPNAVMIIDIYASLSSLISRISFIWKLKYWSKE